MRLKVGRLGRLVKRDLPIEFGREQLTSYGGLELLRRYFHLIGLNQRLRRGFREHQVRGDYSCTHLVLLVIALLVVGARFSTYATWPAIRCSRGSVVWPAFPAIARSSTASSSSLKPRWAH